MLFNSYNLKFEFYYYFLQFINSIKLLLNKNDINNLLHYDAYNHFINLIGSIEVVFLRFYDLFQ
jgi:hypothetical protein